MGGTNNRLNAPIRKFVQSVAKNFGNTGNGGYLGGIDHTSGQGATSHLTVFTYNQFGELSPSGNPLDLAAPSASGVAVMRPDQDEED